MPRSVSRLYGRQLQECVFIHFPVFDVLQGRTDVVFELPEGTSDQDWTTMRWFRKSEDNAPRLISLSPLRAEAAAAAAAAAAASAGGATRQTQWAFQYTPSVALGDVDRPILRTESPLMVDHYVHQPSHLPCTLKRKPAVRRRTGGISTHMFPSYVNLFTSDQERVLSLKRFLSESIFHLTLTSFSTFKVFKYTIIGLII